MALFKCKMCGGALEINNNETVATCEYCGTQQTLPKLDDDRRANLYDRANHFRRNNEFDKAMDIYENILNEDNTDAEAYWSLVLCRYGIEYVEDPSSHKRIPTVNRAQFTSVFDDDNYKSALQYADSYQHHIYEEEAKTINEIQKNILAISQKEEPFDVFICYKESDNGGRRTPDSVLAQDLYYQLTQEGFKVFFARITLEDKLGSAYEPYIFAALNSSKIMVVLGTKPEFFNAVWVKNEWSRYLALIKQGQKKMLIPAYKDMDPYDLPEEFSHLQAQDMSKLGFMQDLIRGIKKITQADTSKTTVVKETVISGGNANTVTLLKRIFMFLEDGDWNSANEYCEKVLDIDPENAQAYLGKLLLELKIRKQEMLKEQAEPFDHSSNYQKAIRFADENLKKELVGYIEHINTRNENSRLDCIYTRAKNAMFAANTESAYKEVAHLFESIIGYLDSATLAQSCYEKAETTRKDSILAEGKSKMSGKITSNYKSAIKLFESISGWKDADEKIYACRKKIEEIEAKAETDRLERKRKVEITRKVAKRIAKVIAIIIIPIVCVAIAFRAKIANQINSYHKFEGLKSAKVGDYVFFGTWEQDNNFSNGKEDIEWLVLEVKDGKALVISKYALDFRQYNTTDKDTTWETCRLRKWLNNDFINAAFSDFERSIIPTVTLLADTNPGKETQDQVFLLSITEANKYFSSSEARQCKPTDYAVATAISNIDVTNIFGNCEWWLRVPGSIGTNIAYVSNSGTFNMTGRFVANTTVAVRPALWIDLKSLNLKSYTQRETR